MYFTKWIAAKPLLLALAVLFAGSPQAQAQVFGSIGNYGGGYNYPGFGRPTNPSIFGPAFSYPGLGYGGYGYQGYGNQGYGNPGFGNPGYNPGFGGLGYGNPAYGNPGYANPGYNSGIANLGYGNQGYGNQGLTILPGFAASDEPRSRAALYPAITMPSPETIAAALATTDDDRARLNIRVPAANARLTLDGTAMKQTGSLRHFVTPPLTPDRDYYFNVQVTWNDETGREQTLSQVVTIRAGATKQVDFK